MVDLYKLPNNSWAVKYQGEIVLYSNIESAAQAMIEVGVRDDEIDYALIELWSKDDTRANFGVNGGFIMSDKEIPSELAGVA